MLIDRNRQLASTPDAVIPPVEVDDCLTTVHPFSANPTGIEDESLPLPVRCVSQPRILISGGKEDGI